jgi:phytoene dehydrogenase-like protein
MYRNTYYVGASTIPGTGLPMAVISSKLTVEKLLNDDTKLSQKQPKMQH